MEIEVVVDKQNTLDEKQSAEKENREIIVELSNIHKTYLLGVEGVPALRGVSLGIFRGEFVVVYGTSGGGKTSLLNIVGTIDRPTKGELRICETTINPKTPDEILAGLRFGFVFQTFNLISSLTARENVELPMTLKGIHKEKVRRELAVESLKKVGLGHRLDHFPAQLSGGEQQRTTIARAIANKPELLLLDEPTGDLDTQNTYRVLDLLTKLNSEDGLNQSCFMLIEGMTMIMVTHDMYLKNFAHRVIWMRDGKVSKIEVIPPEARLKAISDLQAKLQKLNITGRISPEKPEILNRESVPETWTSTEIRQPRAYKPIEYSHQKSGHVRHETNYTHPSLVSTFGQQTLNATPSKNDGSKVYPEEAKSPDSGFQTILSSPPLTSDSSTPMLQDHSLRQ